VAFGSRRNDKAILAAEKEFWDKVRAQGKSTMSEEKMMRDLFDRWERVYTTRLPSASSRTASGTTNKVVGR
jgi:hypothetical protein